MKPSELKISISVESYDEKTAGNYRNCFVVEKIIVKIKSIERIEGRAMYDKDFYRQVMK